MSNLKVEFEMSEDDLSGILDACKSIPLVAIHCGMPTPPQERANMAWEKLGKKLGFEHMTVEAVSGKSERFFSAIPAP